MIPLNKMPHGDMDDTKTWLDPDEERIDRQLVDFFTYSLLESDKSSYEKKYYDLKCTMREVETSLNVLQSKFIINNDFVKHLTNNRLLDSIDHDILHEYTRYQRNLKQSGAIRLSSSKLFPPNVNTCYALRRLLIHHAKHKQLSRPKLNLTDCSFNNTSENEPYDFLEKIGKSRRKLLLLQINMFYHQFYRLFKWPGMLSSMQPRPGLLYGSQNIPMQHFRKGVEKHYTRQNQATTSVFNPDISNMSQQHPGRSGSSAKNCTESIQTEDTKRKNREVKRCQFSIQQLEDTDDIISTNMIPDDDIDTTKTSLDLDEERIDQKLVNFFTFSLLERNKNSYEKKDYDLKCTVREVETSLNALQSKLVINNEISYNRLLDPIDHNILYNYRRNQGNLKEFGVIRLSIAKLFPPNVNNCCALRRILIHYTKHEQLSRSKMNLTDCLYNNPPENEMYSFLEKVGEFRRKRLLLQINIFYHCFYKLFKWAAMLSSMQPHPRLLYSSQNMLMRGIRRRVEKQYCRQNHGRSSGSKVLSKSDRSEYSSGSQQYPEKRLCSDDDCTEVRQNATKFQNGAIERSQISIQIIRSAKNGTEVIQVLPNTCEGGTTGNLKSEVNENRKINQIAANSASKQLQLKAYSRKNLQIKNEYDAGCSNRERSNNTQNEASKEYIENTAEISSAKGSLPQPFNFVNVKCEIPDDYTGKHCPDGNYPTILGCTATEERTHNIRKRSNNESSMRPISNARKIHTNKSIIAPLKLVPVAQKSVIKDLMKDKSKKLFILSTSPNKIQVETFIKEMKLNRTESVPLIVSKISPEQKYPDRRSRCIRDMDDTISLKKIEDEDIHDGKDSIEIADEVAECEVIEQKQRDEKECGTAKRKNLLCSRAFRENAMQQYCVLDTSCIFSVPIVI
ncbi:unnamed protein product [Acanthoscelides obtectus]|uniref:Uncharacterized protein n=1 Tax=Acanthoscelides obtectus TaxID=200917 RepID=A0A9P0PFW8_ACAOB|nr:unnamed protein product [Acanthoscelides obtectus]CAK1656198.1 hypothetical protein AOBTE_LOCUS19611 [Acanthoscelides obtectus]